PFGSKTKHGLIGSRSHDVAFDRLEERLDESGVHGVPAYEFVCGFEPVDASVLSSDEAVKARRHVDRYVRIRVCHRFVPKSSATASSTARSRLRLSPPNAQRRGLRPRALQISPGAYR